MSPWVEHRVGADKVSGRQFVVSGSMIAVKTMRESVALMTGLVWETS